MVTDATGAKVTGASVSLISNGKVVASSVSTSDGSFQIHDGNRGPLLPRGHGQELSPVADAGFLCRPLDSIERNLVLEPEWVRESIVVTATGTPTPQPQTSSATTVLSPLDLALRTDLVSALRLMPGAQVVQDGQLGAQTSLFVRGGDSDDNKILLDGIDASDLGNQFSFGPLSTTAVESVEVYRGPDSTFSAQARDQRGEPRPLRTAPPASLPCSSRATPEISPPRAKSLQVAGAHKKLDYLGAFSWLQTANDLPNDEYHVATSAANLGWQLNGTTQIRATLHYGVDCAPAFPTHGTSTTSPTTPRRRTRTFL